MTNKTAGNKKSSVKMNNSLPLGSGYQWRPLDPQEKGKRQTLFGICGACMQRDCGTLIRLQDGVVVRVEGNPDTPPNFGVLCARGNSQIMSLYNPYRVKSPMVRTNPAKGLDIDPMWKEVTWEEALSIITEKLKKIREKDPRGLVVCEGFGESGTILRSLFTAAYGTPNEIATHGPLCTIHYASSFVHGAMPEAIAEMEYCEYLLSLGRSLGPNFATAPAIRRFTKAMDRGMKLVVVDPHCSIEASKGEWVPIRPGSDLAFLLAMAHVMMSEGLQTDEWFLKNRTNAPYLIAPDGYYYRDPATNKPVMWDPVESQAKTFDSEFKDIALLGSYSINGVFCRTGYDLIKEEYAKYTPEWAEKICTVPAKTIRRISREFVEHAKIGSTIKIEDFTFPFRPASINTHRGVNGHRGGSYADLVGKIINMLVGNIEVPGGCVGNSYRGPLLEPDEDGVVKLRYQAKPYPFKYPPDTIDMHEYYPNKHSTPHLAVQAILNPEKYHIGYQVEAWLTMGSNPIRKNAEPDVYIEAFKKIPFHVSFAYHMDEPAILADIVLPAHSALESARCIAYRQPHQTTSADQAGMYMAYIRQPVPPVFHSRHTDDILMDLAERLGILYGLGGVYDRLNHTYNEPEPDNFTLKNSAYQLDINKKYTLEEIYDRQLKSWSHGNGRGLDELKRTGFVKFQGPRKHWYTYYFFPDNKTRHPFYFENQKKSGDTLRANLKKYNLKFPGIEDEEYVFEQYHAIPFWIENSEINAPPEYDLWVVNWKTPYYSHDQDNVGGNPWLAEISERDPFDAGIFLNSATAQQKGLQDGDTVTVASRYGKTSGRLRITELLHPDAVGIPGNHGMGTIQSNPLNRVGASFNSLLTLDEKTLDIISGGQELSPRVKIYKSGAIR
jgi:anaerobic selenocysteine-containing dehydrogenase